MNSKQALSESKVAITKAHYFLLHSRLGSSMSKVVPICVWTALSLYNPVCMLPGWPSGKSCVGSLESATREVAMLGS